MASTIARLFARTQYVELAVFLRNHLPVVLALIFGVLLFSGSQRLNKVTPHHLWHSRRSLIAAGLLGLAFGAFAWSFYHSEAHLRVAGEIPRFSLSPGVLLFTYVLPHVVLWITGLLACVNLANYARRVKGKVYKSLLKDLSTGILIVVACTFLVQYLIITTPASSEFDLRTVLIYIILLLTTGGFILVYQGTGKLQLIETASRT